MVDTNSSLRELPPGIAALVGVVVGFVLNLIGEVLRDVLRERSLRRRLASALLSEVSAIRDRYWEVFGEYISKWQLGQPLDKIGDVARNQNFFTVYDGNTDKLGMFKRDDVQIIVQAYTLAKAHLESLRQASDAFDKYSAQIVQLASAAHPGASQLSTQLSNLTLIMGRQLKDESERLLKVTDEAIRILAAY